MVTLIEAHRVRIAKSCLTKIARVKCVFAYRLSPAEINLECVLLWRRRRRQTWSTKRNFGAGTKTVTGLNFETNVDVMDQLIELCVFCNFLCLYFSLFSVCQYFHSVSNIFLCFSFTFFYVHLCMIAPFVNLYFTVLCLLYFSLFFFLCWSTFISLGAFFLILCSYLYDYSFGQYLLCLHLCRLYLSLFLFLFLCSYLNDYSFCQSLLCLQLYRLYLSLFFFVFLCSYLYDYSFGQSLLCLHLCLCFSFSFYYVFLHIFFPSIFLFVSQH